MLNRHVVFFSVYLEKGRLVKNVRSLFARQKMGKVIR